MMGRKYKRGMPRSVPVAKKAQQSKSEEPATQAKLPEYKSKSYIAIAAGESLCFQAQPTSTVDWRKTVSLKDEKTPNQDSEKKKHGKNNNNKALKATDSLQSKCSPLVSNDAIAVSEEVESVESPPKLNKTSSEIVAPLSDDKSGAAVSKNNSFLNVEVSKVKDFIPDVGFRCETTVDKQPNPSIPLQNRKQQKHNNSHKSSLTYHRSNNNAQLHHYEQRFQNQPSSTQYNNYQYNSHNNYRTDNRTSNNPSPESAHLDKRTYHYKPSSSWNNNNNINRNSCYGLDSPRPRHRSEYSDIIKREVYHYYNPFESSLTDTQRILVNDHIKEVLRDGFEVHSYM